MAQHGTRTMYVHYKCRCESCCRAEHEQYLKRTSSKVRNRTFSKWGDEVVEPQGKASQSVHNKNRYKQLKLTHTNKNKIKWQDLSQQFGMICAICGCQLNENDTWINEKGRKCFGRTYPTVDHIVSFKNGGLDTMENVQLACKHCNSSKGAK